MALAVDNLDETRELVRHSGMDYRSFLLTLAKTFGAKRYFEIGTQQGISLEAMPCDAIAVDPAFQIDRSVIGNKDVCMLFRMTSDRFFASYDPCALFGAPIDIAFLDGMHRYEYLMRDFASTERFCRKNSIILLHDCLPPTFEMTCREDIGSRKSQTYRGFWTGDVWKFAAILLKYRSDLVINYFDCPPTGIVMVTNLDPSNDLLKQRYFEMTYEFHAEEGDFERLWEVLNARPLIPTSGMKGHELTKYCWV